MGNTYLWVWYNLLQEPSDNSSIVLAKLSRPVEPGNPYIQTIALAPKDDYDYVGGNCYIASYEVDLGG